MSRFRPMAATQAGGEGGDCGEEETGQRARKRQLLREGERAGARERAWGQRRVGRHPSAALQTNQCARGPVGDPKVREARVQPLGLPLLEHGSTQDKPAVDAGRLSSPFPLASSPSPQGSRSFWDGSRNIWHHFRKDQMACMAP